MLNSNRLRTFEDGPEAKFGLTTRDSKPSESGARGHSDPTSVDPISILASGRGKGKGSSSPRADCFKCGSNNFQRERSKAGYSIDVSH